MEETVLTRAEMDIENGTVEIPKEARIENGLYRDGGQIVVGYIDDEDGTRVWLSADVDADGYFDIGDHVIERTGIPRTAKEVELFFDRF